MSTKTIRDSVGQLLVGGFSGQTVPESFASFVAQGIVGGAILFRRNAPTLAAGADLVRRLRNMDAPEPLWLGVDQEGGRVQRFPAPFPQLPPMRLLGADLPEQTVSDAAHWLGAGLRRLGVHQNYAPVVDVDTNPDNPVIGDRSFSSDPDRVSRLACLFVDALQAEGVAACAKHFPGHGDTHLDSHFALPVLAHGHDRLAQVELKPFEALARSGVAAIMTAHIVFPALDPVHPVTLSERVIGPILRERFGFSGVVVSDDLEMAAIADHYGIGEAAVRAVRAGCDQLLVCHRAERIEAAYEALIRAVETGTLAADRVEAAATRVRAMKTRFRLPRPEPDVASHFPLPGHDRFLAGLGRRVAPSEPVEAVAMLGETAPGGISPDPSEPIG